VQRRVALKIIRAGLDTHRLLARFEQERQALALMDHPNIAKVFDAGIADLPSLLGGEGPGVRGTPYFAMELVKGLPLTRYCDDARLSPRQRLELFIPVCQAVQHAHQKGIIHRDLKPSNILVGLYDGRPVPKVIDFGVAKATGPRLTEQSVYTEVGSIIGTLEYMSPEQAELNNLDIDTRSDIYALGVILYELLTGVVPLSRKELEKADLAEMLRVIKEVEPPRPSTRLSHSDTLPSIAAQRQMEPRKLTALVRGELDWIVMKALEKDRGRRYETATGFALDVQRYLAEEPVLAAPASQWYRLRKLLWRHRGPVVAAGLVLLTLVGGISGTTWGLLRAEQQRQLAEAKKREAVEERDAKASALKAEQKARQQVWAALQSMTTEVVERKFTQGAVLTHEDRGFLRSVIAQFDAFAAIQGDDADSRIVRAEGRRRVGNMRRQLGELKEAEEDYDRSLRIYKQLAADFPNNPAFRLGLGDCHNNRGLLLQDTGRLPQAEKDYAQALRIYQQLAGDFPKHPDVNQRLAGSHLNRGLVLISTGRIKAGERDYDQALRIQKQLAVRFPARGEVWEDLAKSFNNRGLLRSGTGRLPEAEKDYDKAIGIYKRLTAWFPNPPRFRHALAGSHGNRGLLLSAMGRLRDAEEDYDQCLSIFKQLAADFPTRPEFSQSLAKSHANRGNLLREKRRLQEAEIAFGQALSIQKQLVADFPTRSDLREDLASSHNNRGLVLRAMGRLREAEEDFDEALSIQKQLAAEFPRQSDLRNTVAGTCVNLSLLQQQQGKWAAAKRLLLEGRTHHLAALRANPRHPTYRQFYRNHLSALTTAHAGLLEQEDAMRTAETRRDVGWNAPADTYDAARFLSQCVRIVARHDKLDARQREKAAQFYGDAAMKLLREAVSKGYNDVMQMKKETDLGPLRQREDFQKLVVELEGRME
jgi:tetratricopeptide (TPR) repeat protein